MFKISQIIALTVCLFSVSIMAQKSIKIMTYNIKLDYPKQGENSWNDRKEFLSNQILFYEPDIFGVQEALPNQMKYLDSMLVSYDFVGIGRDSGNNGEFSAIFYNRDKCKIIQASTFWLSETPEEPSRGWDARFNRICTYALFENEETNENFWVFNTHLDHEGKVAREQSLKLIDQQIDELNTDLFPVVLMGDLNLEPQTELIQWLKKKYLDSKEITRIPAFGPQGTFNGFEFHKPVTRRIDYIFVSENIQVEKYAVLSDSKDCKYPSDHLPVLASIILTK